jgi:hypothetical protein
VKAWIPGGLIPPSAGSATLGEIYCFISGLYFRGKIAYAAAFGALPDQSSKALVIVPGLGLLPPDTVFSPEQLRATARIDVDENNPIHHDALLTAAASLDRATSHQCDFVLLRRGERQVQEGTAQSAVPSSALSRRIRRPGDLSRGGIMLRSAASGQELRYIPVSGAQLRGPRPVRLNPKQRPKHDP